MRVHPLQTFGPIGLVVVALVVGISPAQDAAPTAVPWSAKPIPDGVYSASFVRRHAEAIGLTDEQTAALETLVRERDEANAAAAPRMTAASEAFTALFVGPGVDEGEAIERIDAVLALEGEARRRELLSLVRIRNLLTEEQRSKLRAVLQRVAAGRGNVR